MTIALPVLSAFSPRATASGSIDPLGALSAYTALADAYIPGLTTVTTRVRYLSWICAGLVLLDATDAPPQGGTADRARRSRLLPFERVVAQGVAFYGGDKKLPNDHPALSGLRGITKARKNTGLESWRAEDIQLLKNERQTGGVGTYWRCVVRCGLVWEGSAALTGLGRRLGEEALAGVDGALRKKLGKVVGGNAKGPRFSRKELVAVGDALRLDGASAKEQKLLQEAILELAEHRLLRAVRGQPGHRELDEPAFFQALPDALQSFDTKPAARLAAVARTTRAFERAHAALLTLFQALQAQPTGARLDEVPLAEKRFTRVRRRLAAMDQTTADDALPPELVWPVRAFARAYRPVAEAAAGAPMLEQLLTVHRRIQLGKLDLNSRPKQPWVSLDGGKLTVADRFKRDGAEPVRGFTHPYRTDQLTGFLVETGALQEVGA
jgi:hypothetical protein